MSAKVVSAIELPVLTHAVAEKGIPLGERLDLVQNVKVKMVVALGGTEITLGKLFSLGAGDVLALDREVDAPVDIRLDDKVVARGHLVAVGDKFGVRIVEIAGV